MTSNQQQQDLLTQSSKNHKTTSTTTEEVVGSSGSEAALVETAQVIRAPRERCPVGRLGGWSCGCLWLMVCVCMWCVREEVLIRISPLVVWREVALFVPLEEGEQCLENGKMHASGKSQLVTRTICATVVPHPMRYKLMSCRSETCKTT
jgi:hypothetical protein